MRTYVSVRFSINSDTTWWFSIFTNFRLKNRPWWRFNPDDLCPEYVFGSFDA